jgi:hypothetical protein
MRDLRLVGLSEDGLRLVLELPDGEQFSLPLDERIHAALRGDRARLGQLQIELESRLRPRDIQARIRSGQTLDQVAKEAGVPVDRVLRYAAPVLHEREHMAQEAAKVSVRRENQEAVSLLGELVGERLEERGVARDALQWDAWRRDDGAWEVCLAYEAAGRARSAQWVYDPLRRTVTPDDDEARWLIEEPTATVVTPLRPVPAPEPEAEPVADVAPERSEAPEPRTPARPAEPRRKKSERATVPSWDEILFGSKKPTD